MHVKQYVHYIALHLLTLDFVIYIYIYVCVYVMSEQKHCIILNYCHNQISVGNWGTIHPIDKKDVVYFLTAFNSWLYQKKLKSDFNIELQQLYYVYIIFEVCCMLSYIPADNQTWQWKILHLYIILP